MTTCMQNQIANLDNVVSAPVAARQDTLAERLHSIRETASLLFNRIIDNIEYGQERLKDRDLSKQF